MNRRFWLTLMFSMALVLQAQGRQTRIDTGWRFRLGDGHEAITNPSAADRWRLIDLPHDWSVEQEAAAATGGEVVGPFSRASIGGYQTGFTVGGEGWYSRTITLAGEQGAPVRDRIVVYFEGAYNQTDVYLNGEHLHFNPYGYSSFRVDLSGHIRGGRNSLLVRVRNEGNNTRWYAGSGIYRHVWLIQTPVIHADPWDTHIQTTNDQRPDGKSSTKASVLFATKVRNDGDAPSSATVSVDILDSHGLTVAKGSTKTKVEAHADAPVSLTIRMNEARLWSTDTPYIYKARVRVCDKKSGRTDEFVQPFGVRELHFSATTGMTLNGEPILLRGGCIHHDNGLLGAAAYDRAETRKLELLKAQGYNAIRCSHNLPSEHFLDACDSLGLMVIDEAFDQWLRQKNRDDYHRFFPEHSTRDVQTMVRRDRNHPCVIAWSIGNEIPGRIEPAGMEAAARLRRAVCELDSLRPVTAAICGWDEGDEWNAAAHNWEQQDARAFQSLDLGGYNYLYDKYERDHQTHPDRVMFGAETYPKQQSQAWDKVERLPYVIGDFIWTAMDYLGEAGIGSAAIRKEGGQSMFQQWPWYNGWCGDIDLIGQKKPQSYYRDVVWRRAPITMGVEQPVQHGFHQSISAWGWQLEEQSWTFPRMTEYDQMSVNVYSRAPRVRLYLNGKQVGEKPTSDTYWAGFSVGYQPGTLRAVNLDADGNEIASETFTLQTTGEPVRLRLTPDRQTIEADGQDLAYVTIEFVDALDRVVTSNSELRVRLSADGAGTLLAAGNGAPDDMASFRSATPRLYKGRALAILKASRTQEGLIRLVANAEGLPRATVCVTTIK